MGTQTMRDAELSVCLRVKIVATLKQKSCETAGELPQARIPFRQPILSGLPVFGKAIIHVNLAYASCNGGTYSISSSARRAAVMATASEPTFSRNLGC